ncbi:hypothetical protein MA16_Dca008040 [Dendrobium catenatum]|uniref:Uncharacterized protein n=1 Tax=Dendrobium catenatum TaxID=906689 RepID=A0A2I0WCT4_9ASPA|nr:hypothetical protein MA16_Dca008040 [Dendrobium catenatum]
MDTDSFGSERDDVAFITKQFKSFLRKNNKYHQKWKRGKDSKNYKSSPNIICFEYRKPGYIKADYSTLKNHSSKEKGEEKSKYRNDKK